MDPSRIVDLIEIYQYICFCIDMSGRMVVYVRTIAMLQCVDRSAGGLNFGESFSGHAPVVNAQASIFQGIWNVCVFTTGACPEELSPLFGLPAF